MLNLIGFLFFLFALLILGSIVHAAFGPAGLLLGGAILLLGTLPRIRTTRR